MHRSTPNLLILFMTLVLMTVFAGCTSSPRIITNRDPNAELTSFRTFGFLQPLSTDRGDARSLISTHLIAATTRELEQRGLQRADADPELLINFFVSTRETVSARTRPVNSVTTHHARGRYATWSGYRFSTSTAEVVRTTEGTIAVDLIDAARNQMVWEGAATGSVTDQTRRNLQQAVDTAIAKLFARFP